MQGNQRRLALVDEHRHITKTSRFETAPNWPHLVEPHPANPQKLSLVSVENQGGLARSLESELNTRQLAGAPAHGASEKPEVGAVDQVRREIVGIADRKKFNCDGSVGIGWVKRRLASSRTWRSRSVSGSAPLTG